jgi:2-hydroxychromene-2-carboxylate isomerase
VSDRAVLDALATEHGVDPGVIDDPQVKQGLFDTTAEAAERGAFGVPTFGVGDRIFYGGDRLHLVEKALGGPTGPSAAKAQAPAGTRIRMFHDFSSPFSYLAATQIERVAHEIGAELEWCPMLLGAVFRQIGTPDVPLFQASKAKQRYLAQDLKDWATWWDAPFAWPSHFPLRSILPLRVSIVDPTAAAPLYRAYWGEGQNISDPATCIAVLDAAGLPGQRLVEATQDPAVKDRLKALTTEAVELGLCGAPSMVLERPDTPPQVFWGQDRIDALIEAAVVS